MTKLRNFLECEYISCSMGLGNRRETNVASLLTAMLRILRGNFKSLISLELLNDFQRICYFSRKNVSVCFYHYIFFFENRIS